ncbi:MAG: hypothetical protein AAF628_22360 [Planctomycetota bacterium]
MRLDLRLVTGATDPEPLTDEVALRPYRPGDEHAILSCYNRIFPNPAGGIAERSLAHWQWKFRDNPVGAVQHVVAEHAEAGIIGSYAGIPVAIWSEQRVQLAAQGVDLMVLPSWRRHGPPPGLFAYLGWKYHELYCGSDDGKVLFTYGWPVPAWRMGQRYLGYWNIRDWDFVFRELPLGLAPRATPEALATAPVARFSADVDALFERLRGGFGLALVRDQRYLNWRYADRPDREYAMFECRERGSGALRGVCVYTVADLMRPGTAFLVDWLAAAEDEEATVSMLAALEAQAVAQGTGVLAAVWNQIDPRFAAFQRLGYQVRGTPYFIVLASFKYDTIYYRDQWYYTMGDSDLV